MYLCQFCSFGGYTYFISYMNSCKSGLSLFFLSFFLILMIKTTKIYKYAAVVVAERMETFLSPDLLRSCSIFS